MEMLVANDYLMKMGRKRNIVELASNPRVHGGVRTSAQVAKKARNLQDFMELEGNPIFGDRCLLHQGFACLRVKTWAEILRKKMSDTCLSRQQLLKNCSNARLVILTTKASDKISPLLIPRACQCALLKWCATF